MMICGHGLVLGAADRGLFSSDLSLSLSLLVFESVS